MMNTLPFLSPSSAPARRVLLAGLLLTLAAGPDASAEGDAPTRASGKEYVLAHPSSFNAPPAGARNPFWPIGWVPMAPVAVTAAQVVPQYDVKAENYVVTSISVDYPPLAVINGKTYGLGDHIPVSPDGKEFVSVKGITDGEVVLDHRGRELRTKPSLGGIRRAPGAK